MAIVVRYVCHHCGAAREGSGGRGWVRCQHCEALIAFDWQAWFDSKEYAAYLRQVSKPEHVDGWKKYLALTQEAEAAAKRNDGAAAKAQFKAAMEQAVSLNPSLHPEEVQTKPAWRARWLEQAAWTMLQQQVDPVAAPLADEFTAMLTTLDYKDPLPTLEKAIANLTAQYQRLAQLDVPEDPDGMPLEQRLRAALSQFVGGYLQLVSKTQQRALLERIYGKENLIEGGDATQDAGGLFREWRCPACGLMTLQSRLGHESTCPACGFRKPVQQADLGLERVEFVCGRCGAPLVLEANELERGCGNCGTWTRRQARTGEAERAVMKDVLQELSQQRGFQLAELPAEGQPGIAVTVENCASLQTSGLARLALGYQAFLGAEQYLALVRGTWPGVKGSALVAALSSVRATSEQESGTTAALTLIDEALRRLAEESR